MLLAEISTGQFVGGLLAVLIGAVVIWITAGVLLLMLAAKMCGAHVTFGRGLAVILLSPLAAGAAFWIAGAFIPNPIMGLVIGATAAAVAGTGVYSWGLGTGVLQTFGIMIVQSSLNSMATGLFVVVLAMGLGVSIPWDTLLRRDSSTTDPTEEISPGSKPDAGAAQKTPSRDPDPVDTPKNRKSNAKTPDAGAQTTVADLLVVLRGSDKTKAAQAAFKLAALKRGALEALPALRQLAESASTDPGLKDAAKFAIAQISQE